MMLKMKMEMEMKRITTRCEFIRKTLHLESMLTTLKCMVIALITMQLASRTDLNH